MGNDIQRLARYSRRPPADAALRLQKGGGVNMRLLQDIHPVRGSKRLPSIAARHGGPGSTAIPSSPTSTLAAAAGLGSRKKIRNTTSTAVARYAGVIQMPRQLCSVK